MTTRRAFLASLSALPLPVFGFSGCSGPSGESASGGNVFDPAEDATRDALCRATTRDAEGPFYVAGAPNRTALAPPGELGTKLIVSGQILDSDCETPIVGLTLDLWQADARGTYSLDGEEEDYRLRGKVTTDRDGRFEATTILPGRYADDRGRFRPAHIHAKMLDRGAVVLTTQLYFAGDPYLGSRDFCTRARTCNSADVARIARLETLRPDGGSAILRANYNLILA